MRLCGGLRGGRLSIRRRTFFCAKSSAFMALFPQSLHLCKSRGHVKSQFILTLTFEPSPGSGSDSPISEFYDGPIDGIDFLIDASRPRHLSGLAMFCPGRQALFNLCPRNLNFGQGDVCTFRADPRQRPGYGIGRRAAERLIRVSRPPSLQKQLTLLPRKPMKPSAR
jgi:hypothetical protein